MLMKRRFEHLDCDYDWESGPSDRRLRWSWVPALCFVFLVLLHVGMFASVMWRVWMNY